MIPDGKLRGDGAAQAAIAAGADPACVKQGQAEYTTCLRNVGAPPATIENTAGVNSCIKGFEAALKRCKRSTGPNVA